ncbi:hypothetical protein RIF29_20312 [Crotalaria pallida]|uniref:Uncharacterized protein n=1 Tax=Crotalaria pallida TaxID=3830 RepID=A0AAN9F2P5_CROPI
MYQVCRKLRGLQKPLRELNRRAYGDIDKKELQLRDELDAVQSSLVNSPDNIQLQQKEKCILNEYLEIKKAAYAFLRQKAKLTWLNEGDENTRIFHNSIKQRQYHNRVLRIQTEHGFVDSQDQIAEAFMSYYEDLFRARNNRQHK